jgi:dihydroorotase
MTDEQAGASAYDLLLKGGHVIDPKNHRSCIMDVAVKGRTIACVEEDINPAGAARVVDVRGRYVTPGLIDMHVHVSPTFPGSVVADGHSFSQGVTTMVDAGSTGPLSLASFKSCEVARSRTRLLAFLNIVDVGMVGEEEQDTARFRPELAAEVALANPGFVVGIKVAHYWTWQPYDSTHGPWDSVERGVQAAQLCHLPVMVDFWPRPERPYYDLLLRKLRPGDIHTHVFAQQFPIIIENGRLNPLVFEARARGIIFDAGHGGGSFWFRNAVPAARQGFIPDSLSTDLHTGSVGLLPGGMLGVMGKFLNMGVPLDEVIRLATVAPAHEIGHLELGTLDVGAEADVAVLDLEEGDVSFVDCGRARMPGDRRLSAALTLRAGEVVYDPAGRTMPCWKVAPAPYWVCRDPKPAGA